MINVDGVQNVQYISKMPPFYANIFFWIAVAIALAFIIYIIIYYVNVKLRNRLGVRIHMPDMSLKTYWFKKGVLSHTFKILAIEKTQDATDIYHTYIFRPECVEHGLWGDYIEYDYAKFEPINPRQRQKDENWFTNISKFISGLLDTDLAIDLLLSQKFKEFVKMMLILICIGVVITIGLGIATLIKVYMQPSVTTCNLAMTNQTLQVLHTAIQMR